MLDIAAQHPDARCDGFDISGDQFPPRSELQSQFGDRVQFHVHDAADPEGVPAEFEGVFDIVAIRLMHINLIGKQWDQAVKNVVSMLSTR